MTTIATALSELGVTEWVLRGEPTTEAEFTTMYAKVTGADANGSAIESQDPDDWGTTWAEVSAKRDELISEQPLKELRAQRDRLIAATDWWATSDREMTEAEKSYRKALPDITDTYSSLDDVVWPTKP